MTCRKLSSFRRGSVWAICASSGLMMTGCTDAIVDAMAAGALGFVEAGVMNTLTDAVFGQDDPPANTGSMDAMMDDSGEDHEEHAG